MHNDAYNAAKLCTIAMSRKESREPPKLHLPNTNQSANLLLLTASIVMSSRRKKSKTSKETKKSRSGSPISSGKTAQKETKPNHIPTENNAHPLHIKGRPGPSDT
ncbi:hypothetical protein V492_02280 [Pseudogymnoascus sp. VKM F-4246]|nr:hypothetical protein V492_02280 [Pseudogymnoascus sp. VKM F-4246]